MTGNSMNDADSPWRFEGGTALAKPHQGLFSDLAQFETLRRAYAQLSEAPAMESPVNGSEVSLAGDEVKGFLQQLAKDLQAGTFRAKNKTSQPDADKVSHHHAKTDLRNRIVQVAVAHALESVFPADPPADPVAWTSAVISKGLSRVYAVTIDEGEAEPGDRILPIVRQHVDDPAFLALLGNVLKSTNFRDDAGANQLASLLDRIAVHHIDQVLHEANVLGRQGSTIHATCIRFDRELALFLDNDAQYDWLLPAVQKRLREALAESKAQVDPEKTQGVDLARGEKLHFLDHEFRLRQDRDGTARVQVKRLVKRVVKAPARKPRAEKQSRRRNWFPKVHLWIYAMATGVLRVVMALAPKPRFEKQRRWNRLGKLPLRVYAVAAGVLIAAGLVAVVSLLWSQGPRLYPVRGQVFYEGMPAAGALVVFQPKDPSISEAHAASALVAADGSYVLGTHKIKDGALAGEYVVVIWKPKALNTLPARYGSRHTSPLKAIVARGPTEVPMFQLQQEVP